MIKNRLLKNDQGQAVVEYVLMLAIVVAMVGVMSTGFRHALISLWRKMARDISAPCAGCPPPPEVRFF